jgi:hypothetical protein
MQDLSNLYADMLEYRQQMDEGVPCAHLWFQLALDQLWSLPLEIRVPIIEGTW